MGLLANIIIFALDVCFWVIIASVVISWLITFEVINIRNQKAANLVRLLDRVTEPVYRPIRKVIPAIAGIDISPIIVIFIISLLTQFFMRFL